MAERSFWLASYPKSGNTWFRSFLTALVREGEVDINALGTDSIFSAKAYVEGALDLDAEVFPATDWMRARKRAFQYLHQKAERPLWVKIHDAFTYDPWTGEPIVPTDAMHAIYLVRNPLDVALSFANHNQQSVERTVHRTLNHPAAGLSHRQQNAQSFQLLGTWSQHVVSWLDQPFMPVYVMRYEDLKARPLDTFREAVRVMGMAPSEEDLHRAMEASRFERLQAQEAEKGFFEKPPKVASFFFKGEAGRWKRDLPMPLVAEVLRMHGPVMKRLGYWDEAHAWLQTHPDAPYLPDFP